MWVRNLEEASVATHSYMFFDEDRAWTTVGIHINRYIQELDCIRTGKSEMRIVGIARKTTYLDGSYATE
jgi:hypothetical protein